jgi:LysM repeat protein
VPYNQLISASLPLEKMNNMKRIIILFLIAPFVAAAQNKPIIIEGTAPGLYITHTVAPKENYYSIGRLYNISPKEIAPFNKLELEKGLNLNQVIKVPLTSNFSQDGVVAADEALVPVYHVVKEKEGLYRISTNYNKLPLETLKQWNNISGETVSNGTKLIVGYLKVKKELSALSGSAKTVAPVTANTVPAEETEKKPEPKTIKETPKTEVAKEAEKKPEPKQIKETPVVKKEEKPEIKEPAPAKKEQPVVVKNEEKPNQETEIPKAKSSGGGFFKNIFNSQSKDGGVSNENGTAAVFKSTSGWDDGKYYCLHNEANPGTIVKITNNATGKSVYAKVLDVMPDIKQNNGVIIRISNAAAAELGQEDGKFDCSLSFSK